MEKIELLNALNLTGAGYEARCLVKLPTGETALIEDVVLVHGEVVIVTTLDARMEHGTRHAS